MGNQTRNIIVGVSAGVVVGIFLACCIFFLIRFRRKRRNVQHIGSDLNSSATFPIRTNDSSSSRSSFGNSLHHASMIYGRWRHRLAREKDLLTMSGIPRYLYKDIQKSTESFTSVIGHGSFGPVYKAKMPSGEVVAVKVLANDSKQGEKEFQTEVLLLSRLHHRSLVNLVGYCVEKGRRILIYEYMSNGNLASHLYDVEGSRTLRWDERIQIALDVSHAIEYLHEGASPSVVHRDLKSANILLDRSMRAKVADFGLSKEDIYDGRKSGLKGTYGYMDPDYVSNNKFTKKSDIYSFGIVLFELITAINPQQGLMDYIDLAGIGGDGKSNWYEIIDKNLVGNCILDEVSMLGDIAYKCVQRSPRRRPSISNVTLSISRIRSRGNKGSRDSVGSFGGDVSALMERIDLQQVELTAMGGHPEEIPSSLP